MRIGGEEGRKDDNARMKEIREKITGVVMRIMKSVRLQRGVGWRAVRVGVVVMVVVVWAWVYLLSTPAHDTPTLTQDDWSSHSPNLQVAPPIRDSRLPPTQPPLEGKKEDEIEINKKDNKENEINAIEDKLKKTGDDMRVNKKKKKPKNNENDRVYPKIFPQRRIVLPGDTGLVVEEEEEEEEEEEGKWNGRNMEEKDKNHAMEEVDEAVAVDDTNDKNKNNDDDFVQEDVGGEAIKKKRQRRDKPQNKTNINNNKPPIIKKKKRPIKSDLENDNHHHHLDLTGSKLDQRSLKIPNDLPGLDLVAVEEEMRSRRSKVKQVCGRNGLGLHALPGFPKKVKYPPTPSYETFYIDRGDRLAWCPIYKAASTSWMYGLLGLAGISESYVKNTKEQVSTVARRVWPALPYDEAKEAMGMCVKALVVRHPFERLASAYRDKLEQVAGGERQGTEHFYQKYGRKIVEKYRNKETRNKGTNKENKVGLVAQDLSQQPLQPPQPPLPPPQRYSNVLVALDTRRNLEGNNKEIKDGLVAHNSNNQPLQPPQPPLPPPQRYSNVLVDNQPPPPQPLLPQVPPPQRYRHIIDESQPQLPPRKEPTFSEFVKYLIDTDLTLYADDHWLPYYLSCTPCLLDFDVIAKFETLDRDQTYLLHKTGLVDKLKFSWQHLTKGNRTVDVVKKYFGGVSKKDLLSLYGKYRLDFEMFDYNISDYLGYVSS